jgi:PAS domain S-box-containing protein
MASSDYAEYSERAGPGEAQPGNEELYRRIVQAANAGIWRIDASGRTILANERMAELLGYAVEELLGRPAVDLLAAQSRRGMEERLRLPKPTAGGPVELRFHRRDGSTFWGLIQTTAWNDDLGGLLAIVTDITDYKQLEEELRSSLQRAQGVVEAAPDAIVIIGSEGCISLVNTQTERMFGYSREELLGRPVEVLMPERFREPHRGHRTHYVAAPTTRPMGAGLQLFARRKDGREFPVEISLSPLKTEAGTLVVSAIRDITERRRLEEENAQLLRSQQEKSRQLQLAIQEAHHRIKNNLQAVSNLLFLAHDVTPEPAAKGPLKDSMERVQAIALVHDLLSHDEAVETVDVCSVAERLIPMVLSSNGYTGDDVTVTLEVPPTSVPSKMATSLALILNELTVNAAKHAFADRRGGRLSVRLAREATGNLLSVQDDGPGLPPEFDSASPTGLGLLVVRTLVERDLEGHLRLVNDRGLLAEVWFP